MPHFHTLTPADLYEADWIEIKNHPIEGQEMLVWVPDGDPARRTFVPLLSGTQHYVVVRDDKEVQRQVWKIRPKP